MARGKKITANKLEALGARCLAELLAGFPRPIRWCARRPSSPWRPARARRSCSPRIDKRIRTTARFKTFIDWDKRKPLV